MGKDHLKKIIFLMMLAAVFLSAAGCAGPKATDDSLKNITGAGRLVIGLDENFPPMGFHDESGELVGFDIDLAKEVCERMGVEPVLKPINWDEKEQELNDGRIDCIWNGLSYTEDRAERMNLSEPYIMNDFVFVVRNDSGLKKMEELKGKTVGTQSGSSTRDTILASEFVNEITLILEDDNYILFEKLEEGSIDAVFADAIFAYYHLSKHDCSCYILPNVFYSEGISIGFRKGDDELRDRIEELLHQMKKDGTLSEISDRWFGTDVTVIK